MCSCHPRCSLVSIKISLPAWCACKFILSVFKNAGVLTRSNSVQLTSASGTCTIHLTCMYSNMAHNL